MLMYMAAYDTYEKRMFVLHYIKDCDMRNLDVTTLRSFVAVAESGGVTRAAGFLHLTQSAVSMQLKRLEDLLGLDLFGLCPPDGCAERRGDFAPDRSGL
jgi:hypothetical protein